jgi:hypothetical protein
MVNRCAFNEKSRLHPPGRRRDLYMVITLKYYRFSRLRTNDLPAETASPPIYQ